MLASRARRKRLLVIPPNGSHARTMLAEELEAKRNRVGLWGAC